MFRKAAISALCPLVIVVAITGLWTAPAKGTDWPQVGGSARHTGVNVREHLITRATVDGLERDWMRAGGARTTPIVADGRIYFHTSRGVTAHNLGSGRLLWRRAALHPGGEGTVAVGERVFVAWETLPVVGGHLSALDPRTGRTVWTDRLPGWPASTPVVAGPRVFVVAGVASGDYLVAVRARDGHELWRRYFGEPIVTPAVARGLVVTSGSVGRVYALDVAKGTQVWRRRLPVFQASADAIPVIGHDHVFISAQQRYKSSLTAVSLTEGTVEWSRIVSARSITPAAVAGGAATVAVDEGRIRDRVLSFDVSTGSRRWRTVLDGYVIDPWWPPVSANGMVFIGTGGSASSGRPGGVVALGLGGGRILWRSPTAVWRSMGPPTVVDGTVIVGASGNVLFAFRPGR